MIRHRSALVSIGIVPVLLAACSPTNEAPSDTAPPVWSLSSNPVVVIGEEEALHRVVHAEWVAGADAAIVVVDAGSSTIRWFDEDGTRRSVVGTRGAGPGEFQSIGWAAIDADGGVRVWDQQVLRVSVVTPEGITRELRPSVTAEWASARVEGGLEGDRLLAVGVEPPFSATEPGIRRADVPVWILAPDGTIDAEVGRLPGPAVEFRTGASPGTVLRGLVPFGPRAVAAARGDRIAVADNAMPDIHLHDGAGNLLHTIHLTGQAPPVVQADLDRELERRLAGVPPIPEIQDGTRAAFAATPVPERMPWFDRILIDPDGRPWIERHVEHIDEGAGRCPSTRWEIFDADGNPIGVLATPSCLRLTAVDRDRVVGVRTDELGVETVVVHALAPNPGD